ncbi:hypothetical protein B0H14DRAFT_2638140 [Mycena olivaceomarginata]|nr:hypothetical protein B0H14DRAFT_2638140 [Mycena olivaceomarginata]
MGEVQGGVQQGGGGDTTHHGLNKLANRNSFEVFLLLVGPHLNKDAELGAIVTTSGLDTILSMTFNLVKGIKDMPSLRSGSLHSRATLLLGVVLSIPAFNFTFTTKMLIESKQTGQYYGS